ncbi:hypothetical protein Pla52o_33590 [Novipirellula galeiformis]|uniref:Uncharacterized protein n=2 Tax=Novipirellula galeiformis TaxID=2528004 RepID=A0A5C6CC01_9BACT|nr:hypothetical protein Pla52o_33590 [Novipirellula galeiformis]
MTTQMNSAKPLPSGFTRLRQLVQSRRQPSERCELCNLKLAKNHDHLVEIHRRNILCCCEACAILFTGHVGSDSDVSYRRVPRRFAELTNFQLSDAQWDDLRVPINVVFFYDSTPQQKVVAVYPSPAGATESSLTLQAWDSIATDNPIVEDMQPDVEALLVNRLDRDGDFQYYLVPIDRCYELVGMMRTHWHGLSGGTEVWREINAFFSRLRIASAPFAKESSRA